MKQNRWSCKQSLDYVRKARKQSDPNIGFLRQLKLYEEQIGTGDVKNEKKTTV